MIILLIEKVLYNTKYNIIGTDFYRIYRPGRTYIYVHLFVYLNCVKNIQENIT